MESLRTVSPYGFFFADKEDSAPLLCDARADSLGPFAPRRERGVYGRGRYRHVRGYYRLGANRQPVGHPDERRPGLYPPQRGGLLEKVRACECRGGRR